MILGVLPLVVCCLKIIALKTSLHKRSPVLQMKISGDMLHPLKEILHHKSVALKTTPFSEMGLALLKEGLWQKITSFLGDYQAETSGKEMNADV